MASTIKQILDSLKPEEKARLMLAFEHGVSQYVKMSDGRYIGVYLQPLAHLTPDPKMCAGAWSVGAVADGDTHRPS